MSHAHQRLDIQKPFRRHLKKNVFNGECQLVKKQLPVIEHSDTWSLIVVNNSSLIKWKK